MFIDNVNCAKNKFSFFGEDFYPSDYPRFCEQLERENQLHITSRDILWAQKLAEYCYQMNRATLHFTATDNLTRILEYDAFNSDKIASVRGLCDFLDLPCSDDLAEELRQPTGPVTTSLSLSQSEHEDILPYDNKYDALCEKYGLIRGKSLGEITGRYEGNCTKLELNLEQVESTTNWLRYVNRALNSKVSNSKMNSSGIELREQNRYKKLFMKNEITKLFLTLTVAFRTLFATSNLTID